jgi:putative ABC transport system permease protein
MIGASLISGSLIVNDSFVASSDKYVKEKVGDTAGMVYSRNPLDSWDLKEANDIYSTANTGFRGFLPFYFQRLTVRNIDKNISKNDIVVSTFDPDLGRLYAPKALENNDLNIARDEVIISTSIADQLKVEVGEEVDINISDRISLNFKIKKIVDDNGIIGYNAPLQSKFGFSIGSIYFAPELTHCFQDFKNILDCQNPEKTKINKEDIRYNSILVSTTESYDRKALEDEVQKRIDGRFSNIIFEEQRQYFSESAIGASNGVNFGQILLIVSVFAILAGLILMINLYYMIAEERKSELGTLRVLGYKKFDIIQLFAFEGFLYSFISALVGTIVGIGIGSLFIFIITRVINNFFSEFDIKTNISLSVNLQSMVFAFSGAWIVTFMTTILSSIKISNLNIVSAIRDLKVPKLNRLTQIKGATGGLIMVLGFVMIYSSIFHKVSSENLQAYFLYFGIIISLWAAGYLLKFTFPDRLVFTLISVFSLILTLSITKIDFFEKAWQNGPYLFFINALVVIGSLTLLVAYNIDVIVKLLNGILSRVPGYKSISSIGFRYPVENRFRTGLTISIFAFVIFIVSLVSILRLQVNQVINKVNSEFDIVILDELSREDLRPVILDNKSSITSFKDLYTSNFGIVSLPEVKYKDISVYDPNSPLPVTPEDAYRGAIGTLDAKFFEKEVKLTSDKPYDEVKGLYLNSSDYVILGKNFAKEADDFNVRPDIKVGDTIVLRFAGNVEIKRKVLAILENTQTAPNNSIESAFSSQGTSGFFLSQNDYELLKEKNNVYLSSLYGIKLQDSQNSIQAGKDVKELLSTKNTSNIIVFQEAIKRGTLFLNQLILMTQGFLAFGLIVGMAGLAVVLVRSINERRQQIGMLKAIGFLPEMIVKIFMLESLLITLLGILIGFVAGVFSSYSFYSFGLAESTQIPYAIPFKELIIIFLVVIFFSLLFAYFPARKGSKMSPTEATNYLD